MKKILLLLAAFLPTMMWAGDNDDFGTWLELGAEKALPYNMELGIEGGLRTKDNSSMMDRWDIGASLGYKASKYLKLSAGYSLLMDYNEEKAGKNWLTPSHWKHRNRIWLEASSGNKFWKWLRLSARVRYQYTYRAEKNVERYECEGVDANTGEYVYDMDYPETKLFEGETRQVLRSRLKVELDKKRLDWKPFVSVEFHNNVGYRGDFNLDKIRTSVGTTYKINKHNDIGVAYVMTLDRMGGHPYQKMHAVSASYSFDF